MGNTLDTAIEFYSKDLNLSHRQKDALRLAYSLYRDTNMSWQEKERQMSVYAGQLEVSESIQAVFGQCDELKFHAYDVDGYKDYMKNEVGGLQIELSALSTQMAQAQDTPAEYCELQAKYIQTRGELYRSYISDRNEIAVRKAHDVDGASTVSFGAAHTNDQISIARGFGPVLEVRTHRLEDLGIFNPYDGSENRFNNAYPVPHAIDCRLARD